MSNAQMMVSEVQGHAFPSIFRDGRNVGGGPCLNCGRYADEWTNGVFTPCAQDRPMRVCEFCGGSGMHPMDELPSPTQPTQCPSCLGKAFVAA